MGLRHKMLEAPVPLTLLTHGELLFSAILTAASFGQPLRPRLRGSGQRDYGDISYVLT